MTTPGTRSGTPFTKVLAGMALAAVAIVAGVALVVREEPTRGGHDVTSLVRRADRLLGERVTVAGRVGEVISAKSFIVTDGGRRLLVLGVSTVPAIDDNVDGVFADERVTVTGVVRRFEVREMESYVGELDDERYQRFAGEPVILADSVVPA